MVQISHSVNVGVIDYGMSNLTSLCNALSFLNIKHQVITEAKELGTFDRLILPGVGAFGQAMQHLNISGIGEALCEEVTVKHKPLIGICLGMQLLFESSTEHGLHTGLGLVKGYVANLQEKVSLPVPHIGWNSVICKEDSKLLKNKADSNYCFYFANSFYCMAHDPEIVSGRTEYGGFMFDVVIEERNVFGCQFHPEKSQRNGLAFLERFGKEQC